MPDKKNDEWQSILEALLVSPPEDVLAMFQNDLRRNLAPIQAGLDILTDEEFTEDESKQLLEMMRKNANAMQFAFDRILDYLKARQAMQNADDKTSE